MKLTSRRHYAILSILMPFVLVGCAGVTITSLGNQILQKIGVLPGPSVFEAGESLVKATDTMTREEEYYLGRAVAAKILSSTPVLKEDRLKVYLNLVGTINASASSRPETFGGYHFELLDSSTPQALSAPGGFIFISKGLIELLPDEDALAAVLAHEVAHVSLQHGVKSISQKHLNDTVLALGRLAGTLNCGQVVQQATGVFSVAVEDIVTTVLEKGYSREQELEADAEALKILSKAGYDTSGLTAALLAITSLSKSDTAGWFSSHPGSTERLERISKLGTVNPSYTNPQGKVVRLERFRVALSNLN